MFARTTGGAEPSERARRSGEPGPIEGAVHEAQGVGGAQVAGIPVEPRDELISGLLEGLSPPPGQPNELFDGIVVAPPVGELAGPVEDL